MRRGGALAFVALSLLAGCTLPAEPTPEPTSLSATPLASESYIVDVVPSLDFAPTPSPTRALDVSLSLSERWLKPFMAFDAVAQRPDGARIAWFVELEGVEPRATSVRGEAYVLKATTPDRNDHDGPRVPLAVTDFAPDGRARALKVTTPGRYTLAAETARVTLNVWPDAPADGAAQAFLVGSGDSLRFDPPELDVAPGGRILLWSQAPSAVDIREAGFAAHVPIVGPEGRVTPIDEGLYRLVALAVSDDGRARGLAREAFLVDFERPSARLSAGPFTGDFLAPDAGTEPPRTMHVRAEHPLTELFVRFEAGSTLPAPASIELSILHEGKLLASASSLTTDEIALGELPAGEITIEVRGEHGVMVWYETSLEGRYRLPTPARLRDA